MSPFPHTKTRPPLWSALADKRVSLPGYVLHGYLHNTPVRVWLVWVFLEPLNPFLTWLVCNTHVFYVHVRNTCVYFLVNL